MPQTGSRRAVTAVSDGLSCLTVMKALRCQAATITGARLAKQWRVPHAFVPIFAISVGFYTKTPGALHPFRIWVDSASCKEKTLRRELSSGCRHAHIRDVRIHRMMPLSAWRPNVVMGRRYRAGPDDLIVDTGRAIKWRLAPLWSGMIMGQFLQDSILCSEPSAARIWPGPAISEQGRLYTAGCCWRHG